MAEVSDILVETLGRVGRISFDRPDTLNALRPETMAAFSEAVAAFEADDAIGAIVVTGRGRAFSSGGDMDFLDELTRMTPAEVKDTVYTHFQGAVRALKLCPKPTVAAVHGAAAGAGCEIAVACDFRVATPEAQFFESWIELAIIPPLGGMFLLPRLVGLGKATEMILLGARVGGEEALELGLVTRLVAEDELQDEALALAGRLAEAAPLAVRVAKEGLRRGMESSLAREWEFNVYAQSMLISSDDFAEAVKAFRERRKAAFRGR